MAHLMNQEGWKSNGGIRSLHWPFPEQPSMSARSTLRFCRTSCWSTFSGWPGVWISRELVSWLAPLRQPFGVEDISSREY